MVLLHRWQDLTDEAILIARPLVASLCDRSCFHTVAADRGGKSNRIRLPPFSPRAELTQESSGSGSGGQAQGLSSDESSSPPSSVPQALNFSPEKSASPPPQGSSTGAAQGEAEPPEDTLPSEVHGGGCSHTPSEVHGESRAGTHLGAGAHASSRLRGAQDPGQKCLAKELVRD